MSGSIGGAKSKSKTTEDYEKDGTQSVDQNTLQLGSTSSTSSQTGTQSSTSTGSTAQTRNPWAEAVPYLQDFLGSLGNAQDGLSTTSPQYTAAVDRARTANAGSGGDDYDRIADDLFGTTSRSGMVTDAYGDVTRRLGETAEGLNLNLGENPYLNDMIAKAQTDAKTSVMEQFAGAGRAFSGAYMQALGQGVTDATLPYLMQQYNTELARTDAAARDLYGYGTNAATTADQLDANAQTARTSGLGVQEAKRGAESDAAARALEIENMVRTQPTDDLQRIANLLFPAAGLGDTVSGTQSSTGAQTSSAVTTEQINEILARLFDQDTTTSESGSSTGTTKSKNSGWGLKADLGTAFGTLFPK